MIIEFPIKDKNDLKKLRAGDRVEISGTIYTARDAAHKKLTEAIKNGEKLPVELLGQAIYYTGPCPAPKGRPIGSCGPTTSARMNDYAPVLLDLGQAAIIGKGNMSDSVTDALKRNGAVYFAACGGAGALLAHCVKECETVAYPELLSEAIYRLKIEKMPLTVAIDCLGNNIYKR